MSGRSETPAGANGGGLKKSNPSTPRVPEGYEHATAWREYAVALGLPAERVAVDVDRLLIDGRATSTWVADVAIKSALGITDQAVIGPEAGFEKKGDGTAKKKASPRDLVRHVEDHYVLGVTTEGEPYVLPKAGTRLPIMLTERSMGLRRRVREFYFEGGKDVKLSGFEAETFNVAVEILINRALAAKPSRLHLRTFTTHGQVVIDLGQPDNTRCAVITPDGWRVEDQPPAGVVFRRLATVQPLPDPTPDGSWEALRRLLGFEADDIRWNLVRGWQVAQVFGDMARPLLFPLGGPGTGKSTRGRFIINVLDPREQLGSSFGRDLDGDIVKAFNRYLVGYDNLTTISGAISDHICRLVTGESAEKRTLYEDTGLTVMSYRRTGVMTGVTLPALREDALERVIPIYLDTMTGNQRRTEAMLNAEFSAAHPAILGALCDALAQTLKGLPSVLADETLIGPRMLDYWKVLVAYDQECADAYVASAGNILREAAEEDDFTRSIAAWVRDIAPEPRHGSSADLLVAWKHWMHDRNVAKFIPEASYVPKDGAAFARALGKASSTLSAIGITYSTSRTNKARTIALRSQEWAE